MSASRSLSAQASQKLRTVSAEVEAVVSMAAT
jgi:hypothetical protein